MAWKTQVLRGAVGIRRGIGPDLRRGSEAAVELPDVNVSASRLIASEPKTPAPARERPVSRPATTTTPRRHRSNVHRRNTPPCSRNTAAAGSLANAVRRHRASVTGTIVTGASSTVITAAEIERSPGLTLQDILSREPGVQVTSLFGGVNGARSTVDLRGFGATASNNTLVLINGRRINDLDLEAVDLARYPAKASNVSRSRAGTAARSFMATAPWVV